MGYIFSRNILMVHLCKKSAATWTERWEQEWSAKQSWANGSPGDSIQIWVYQTLL